MPELKGSQTHQNLKDAFAGESQANRRYLYYAKQADVEGYPEIASNFRETAEGETGHAHGHLDYIKQVGDPANDMPIGESSDNLKAAIAGETHEYTDMYPGMAKTAREEGFSEIADWFETLAKAEKSHATPLTPRGAALHISSRSKRVDEDARPLDRVDERVHERVEHLDHLTQTDCSDAQSHERRERHCMRKIADVELRVEQGECRTEVRFTHASRTRVCSE